jgi:hypothetical protein
MCLCNVRRRKSVERDTMGEERGVGREGEQSVAWTSSIKHVVCDSQSILPSCVFEKLLLSCMCTSSTARLPARSPTRRPDLPRAAPRPLLCFVAQDPFPHTPCSTPFLSTPPPSDRSCHERCDGVSRKARKDGTRRQQVHAPDVALARSQRGGPSSKHGVCHALGNTRRSASAARASTSRKEGTVPMPQLIADSAHALYNRSCHTQPDHWSPPVCLTPPPSCPARPSARRHLHHGTPGSV